MSTALLPRGVPFWKRVFDLLLAGVGLILISPLLLLIAAAVLLTMGRPVLFRQVRPGLHGRPFTIYKFRTMREAGGYQLSPDHDQARMTGLGRFLRSASLDELPELFNVLKGEMSLVGPRPLLMRYLDRYTPEQARRHEVLPGITGWAQVNGRNILDWGDRFEHDIWYVDHCSLLLDTKILAMTLWKVMTREGIRTPGHPSAPEFMGSANGPRSGSQSPDGDSGAPSD